MALNWFSLRQAARTRVPPDAAAPARPVERSRPHMAAANGLTATVAADGPPIPWPDVVRLMGEEVSTSLNAASEQLDRLNRLEPGLVNGLGPLRDSIERARQAGLAAQQMLRLREDPPAQHREVLNLADVARAALTTRSDWFKRRQVSVRQGLAQAQVFADSSMTYLLIDEMLQWAGQLSPSVAITVDRSSRAGRPRLRVAAWCDPATTPEASWRSMRWMLWHQLARALDAQTQMEMRDDHVRVTVSLAAATDTQLAAAAEEHAGPSSVSAVIQGCRVLVVSTQPQRRAQCLQALAGYGVLVDQAEDAHQARRLANQHLPDALVYDASVPAQQMEHLREQIGAQAGSHPAMIEINEQAGATEFQASTIGAISTGRVAAGAIGQSLGPALVFELCKVM
ncbi:hypothetical protein FVQ98_15950 [Ottowia sp. GY511]|uniref:Response regulatory domain-containing protein n=1 Tax=Ottowia flava TaxID=2675430 RepID=A0ABW4KUV9_9BURK|nr:hypothetical protein [Ottowia sp. GY511]TXK24768.1 hypothetical protein FVQ98_15950 [Ottowia sp. GY511]